jgi:hypothetical protein
VSTLLDIILVAVPLGALIFGSLRYGVEQRPGMGGRRPERYGERWTIR